MLATAALLKVGVIFSCSIRFQINCSCPRQVYPTLLALAGLPVLLLLHSTLLLAAAFFVLKFLPETRNRSLTEIHQHFSRTKVDPTLSGEHNLPTHVSETVKEAPGVVMIDTVKREKKEEVELDCESVESRLQGVRRRSTMVNPAVQPKLQNFV